MRFNFSLTPMHYRYDQDITGRFPEMFGVSASVAAYYVNHWTYGAAFPQHDHDFLEVQVWTAGKGIHVTASGKEPMKAGQAVIVRPGVWHALERCENVAYWVLCIPPRLLHHELSWTLENPQLNHLFWNGVVNRAGGTIVLDLGDQIARRCDALLSQSVDVARSGSGQTRVRMLGLVIELLAEFADAVPELIGGNATALIHPACRQAMRLMEQAPANPWTTESLSEMVDVAPAYLSRIFRAAADLTPMHYLARVRSELAASLLLRTERTISEIGRDVGWPDPNYFARQFRKHLGVSAREYRKRFRT